MTAIVRCQGQETRQYHKHPYKQKKHKYPNHSFHSRTIPAHVREVGAYLAKRLDELVARHDCLTTRRGVGLMQGVACTKKVGEISAKALEHGLVVITAGSDVLRFVPPLVIEKAHVDEMIEKLEACL